MRHVCFGLSLLCALTLGAVPAQADLRTTPANSWVTGPRTRAVVRAGDRLFVGGNFTSVYPAARYTGWLATFDPGADIARALPPLSGGYVGVTALADDGAGGWFVAGDFYRVGDLPLGVLTPRLLRIRHDGTVQQLATDAAGAAYNGIVGLARSGDTLFVVFYRTWYFLRRTYIAYDLAPFDVATGIRRGPDVGLGSTPPVVTADHAHAYVFGAFTDIAGAARTNAAAFDAATLALTAWAPPAPAGIRTAQVAGESVYVAGAFSDVAGASRGGLAAFSTQDGTLQPWAPSSACAVSTMAVATDRVYLGACLTTESDRGMLTAVDRGTGAPTGWSATLDGPARAMATVGSTLYVAGRFASVGGVSRLNAASFTDGALTNWDPRPSEAVTGIVATPGGVALGGEFTGLGALARPGVAEFDVRTGTLTPWLPPLLTRGYVWTLATDGRWLFVLGNLEGPAVCMPVCGLIAVALDGSSAIPVPEVSGVASVATARDRLYIGGLDGVIGIDTVTGRLLPWRAPVDVWGPMLATDEFVYAARSPTDGTSPLKKIDTRTGVVLPWAPGDVAPSILGLATYGPWLLIGRGEYPENLSVLVAVDQATGRVIAEAPRSLVPAIDTGGLAPRGATGPVVTPRGILVSSNATIIGILPSGVRSPWSVSTDGAVSALYGDERVVVVGGDFVRAGGVVSPGLAILPEAVPTAPTGLAAETIGATVGLRWTRPSDGDPLFYRLEAGTVPFATDIGAWTLPPTPLYDVGGVPDGRYFVRVRAGTGAGNSPSSNEVEVIVGTPPPLAPTDSRRHRGRRHRLADVVGGGWSGDRLRARRRVEPRRGGLGARCAAGSGDHRSLRERAAGQLLRACAGAQSNRELATVE